MIRNFSQNVRNVFNSKRFLYSSVSNIPIFKKFQHTDILENVKKSEESKFEQLKKYRQAEVHLWHSLGPNAYIDPKLLTEEQWEHIYELEAKHQRKRYCMYLVKRMKAKADQKANKEEERESRKGIREKVRAERDTNQHLVYGLGHNSLLLRVNNQAMNKWFNIKLHRAKMHGQKLIVDCSYEKYMTDLERSKVVKNLMRLYADNRRHIKPMDLHFCGVQPESVIIKNLGGQIPTLLSKSSPTGVHTKCFTELYSKERLVMLTPDSDWVLEYKFDDIYIIGGIVDFGRNDPLTLAKAKKLGIRSARLPLDNLRMLAGDSIELPLCSAAAFLRERQVNTNVRNVIEKTVYLRSKLVAKREEEKYRNILKEP